jgi:hypothetical protein
MLSKFRRVIFDGAPEPENLAFALNFAAQCFGTLTHVDLGHSVRIGDEAHIARQLCDPRQRAQASTRRFFPDTVR